MWWRDAVVYQVYLRSFADADGDGVGDLDGLRTRLDYLTALGVDGIWLNPCYPSPGADHGYDVADYTGIDTRYGGLPAFDRLLADAHARGLKVFMDLVPNHCSVEHPWFRAALAGDPAARERFIFRPDRDGDPPNNWLSVFGGPAWTRVGDAWYLHSFDPAQPDFNWRNPEVAAYFEDVLRFWFDRGVDGFRIDVVHMLFKHADLPDWPHHPEYNILAQNQPEVHEVLRRWRKLADARERTLVGEIWVPTVGDLALYLRPDELQQAFYFDLLVCPWDAARFRDSIDRGLEQVVSTGAVITWTLANHDVHRAVSRYGLVSRTGGPDTRPRGTVDVELGVRRARAAAMLVLALPGSVYLYQGEEAGLPEVMDLPDEARQDPTWFRSGRTEHGRDGCRVPLPWTAAGPSFGFSASAETWLPQPEWFGAFAIEEQMSRPESTWSLHRDALRMRPGFEGPLEWLPTGREDVLAFRRGDMVCVTVFGGEPYPVEHGTPVLASAEASAGAVAPGSTAWFRR
ncbi:glycoside hydrolase family 13 protein [Planomonospora venezuelensis]|uniref:Alpha-glucosidase n=1 Tax=Planomonospora venezuelensis TaxID=1999 RepID=A0A841D097_PLAVE|nr:glycoside hydrolase family 13 protein [Planomonospora venezuelensis]MBB5961697.1 alpha-glucosidase [Planomonospora venezuelensis]GIM98843.1 alpha-glucosidase [Planomonospora venezuelensis]